MSNKRVNPFKLKLHLLECEADEKDKKISDLEAKLAESEKQRQHLKDWLDNEILTSVDSESYYATINEYEEEVKKLKQRLEESESELVLAKNTSINTNKMEILHLQIENEELKQQLAEKDEEIAYLTKQVKKFNNEAQKYFEDAYCNDFHNQDKISFCIEQLEKVKETTECILDNALKNSSLNQSYYDRLLDEIDNQIKQLKVKAERS